MGTATMQIPEIKEGTKCEIVFLIYEAIKIFYLGRVTKNFKKTFPQFSNFSEYNEFAYLLYLFRLKLNCLTEYTPLYIVMYRNFHRQYHKDSYTMLMSLINTTIVNLDSQT